jgi:ketosteroid isomerase-like protein
MSQKNVDWVKASLEHFARTGEPYLVGVDASVEVFDHDIPDARNPYRGIEGISAWLADFGESWDSYEMDIKRILDAGDRVVALFRIRAVGAGSGARVERDDGIVWTFGGGTLIRIDYFNDPGTALEAAGLDG